MAATSRPDGQDAAASFTNITLSGVVVSGGPCAVGVTAGGSQVTVDDFVLSGG